MNDEKKVGELSEKEFMERINEDINEGNVQDTLNVDIDINSLIKFGVIEKEFELVKDKFKVKMHTLTDDERAKSSKLIGKEDADLEYFEKYRE